MPPPAPTCPRCAYDLSGLLTWPGARDERADCPDGAACPLRATCSECGLTFEWRLIFHPFLDGLPWFIESPRPPRRRLSWLRTARRVLVPWSFWRDVSVETPVSARGLVRWLSWWVIAVIVLPVVATILLSAISNTQADMTWRKAWGAQVTDARSGVLYYGYERFTRIVHAFGDLLRHGHTPPWVRAGIITTLATPLVSMLLPWTPRQSKARVALILRATSYSLAWVIPFVVWMLVSWICEAFSLMFMPSTWGGGAINAFIERSLRTIADYNPIDWYVGGCFGRPPPTWLAVIPVTWLACFWLFAMKRSWRMPDWLPAWLSCIAVALVASILIVLFDESVLQRVF